ncbi:hypothetical protein PanWU01x14_236260 [Parasponia andersonii]|uniref:Uncharacterized protein n=1 Tax=Parasponia andersonii TaxID=3476 RepID=A0A2P5BIF1_PARAD|nr:hypothetical protein PanWU01x14_236260 [Parasponia andersonii]
MATFDSGSMGLRYTLDEMNPTSQVRGQMVAGIVDGDDKFKTALFRRNSDQRLLATAGGACWWHGESTPVGWRSERWHEVASTTVLPPWPRQTKSEVERVDGRERDEKERG